ncbi:uncharacterized protein LOC113205149 [Frankliniella occidentalis]|uniref:Uncharacterized protein LOC113205149 n=1 Tax=Frankliniella occidentalis TaxID=133901 RepID=A0A6J1S6Z3_FRAOC|nr:uncharacterized protein LOC113205149 [Frankliniella occidentalis]
MSITAVLFVVLAASGATLALPWPGSRDGGEGLGGLLGLDGLQRLDDHPDADRLLLGQPDDAQYQDSDEYSDEYSDEDSDVVDGDRADARNQDTGVDSFGGLQGLGGLQLEDIGGLSSVAQEKSAPLLKDDSDLGSVPRDDSRGPPLA